MGELIHTRLSKVPDLFATQQLVAALLPHLKWRRHGIGVLQGYVHEHPEHELRVHLWSPMLIVPGIIQSGNAHNHRFAMRSRVLLGDLQHTEWQLHEGDGYALYDFKHARIHATDDDRVELSPLPVRYAVTRRAVWLTAGDAYEFDRGAYHDSLPMSAVAVTLVEKYDQREERARVIAPADKPPVPAFGEPEPNAGLVAVLVDTAIQQLRAAEGCGHG